MRKMWVGAALVGLALAGRVAGAQSEPDASVGAALRSLASRAQSTFVGQVESVTRGKGVVEVVFRVDTAVDGVAVGGHYTLREWDGLWNGSRRYRVGLRALVFAQAQSAAGLTSPVDGPEGVVPVQMQGAGAEPLADLRLLATRMVREPGVSLAAMAPEYVSLSDAVSVAKSWREPTFREPGTLPVPVMGGAGEVFRAQPRRRAAVLAVSEGGAQ